MLMGRDYMSELWPPVGLLFSPQVIYEHGELWWNDIDRKTTDLSTRALAILPAESSGSSQEEQAKEMMNLFSFVF
jgi:hypothetical protein